MILNPIICKECGNELQPEDVGIRFSDNNDLVRVCCFCDDEVIITDAKGDEDE